MFILRWILQDTVLPSRSMACLAIVTVYKSQGLAKYLGVPSRPDVSPLTKAMKDAQNIGRCISELIAAWRQLRFQQSREHGLGSLVVNKVLQGGNMNMPWHVRVKVSLSLDSTIAR